MSSDQQQQLFLTTIKDILERRTAMADPAIAMRLRQARAQVLQQPRSGLVMSRWAVPATTGVAFATVAALALSLWIGTPQEVPMATPTSLEDLEIISSSEDLDFFDELEFYRWLANSGHLG